MRNPLYISTAIMALLAAVCSSPNAPEPGNKIASRTVLVYIIADNSLGSGGYDAADLLEMQESVAAGSLGDSGRLLVYHNQKGTSETKPPILFEYTVNGTDTLKTYPEDGTAYSTDVARMTEVFADIKELAPALDYGLVLWSHGSGWIEPTGSRSSSATTADTISDAIPPKQKTFGDDRGTYMKITSLAQALDGQGFSFIYFDCCFMASIEIVYELRHATPVIVGSGTELHAEGMRYDINIPCFFADEPDMLGAAQKTFEYYNSRTGTDRTCTMSVIYTDGLDDLAEATRQIMALGPNHGKSIYDYQRYMRVSNTLWDMGEFITTLQGVDAELLNRWQQAFDNVVAYAAATPTIFKLLDMNYYSGLGTFIISEITPSTYLGYQNQSWWTDVVSHNPNY